MSNIALKMQHEKFWQEHIQSWAEGKLSQRAYCELQAISFASFGYWRKRFSRRMKSEHPAAFIEAQTPSPHKSRAPAVQILLANGVRVGVSHDASVAMVREIFNMISASC